MIPGTNTKMTTQITKSSQTGIITIDDPALIALQRDMVVSFTLEGQYVTDTRLPTPIESIDSDDFIAVIATPNFFVAALGENNVGTPTNSVRVRGYRAVATADLYAALVTEEINS